MNRNERIARAIMLSGKKKLEIARECSVSNASVSQWLTGESKSLKPENLYALAKATGFKAKWLAIGEGPERDESNIESGPEITSPFRAVKIVGTAQMGSEGYWAELDEGEGVVEVPSSDPDAYALRLRGDSMSPAIRSGWIAVIEPSRNLVPGEYVLLCKTDGECMLKELLYANDREVSLMSINAAYGRLTIPIEDVRHLHYVGAIVPPSKVRL